MIFLLVKFGRPPAHLGRSGAPEPRTSRLRWFCELGHGPPHGSVALSDRPAPADAQPCYRKAHQLLRGRVTGPHDGLHRLGALEKNMMWPVGDEVVAAPVLTNLFIFSYHIIRRNIQ